MLRKLGYCLLGLLTLGGSALAAQVQDIPLLADAGDEPALTIMESRDDALRIKIDIPRLTREELAIDNRLFQLLSFKGAEYEGEEGQPALPIFSRLVAVPAGASVSLNVASSKETTLEGYRILPQQPEEGTSFVIDEDHYRTRGLQRERVSIGEPAMLRGMQVVPLVFRPLDYDPSSGEVVATGSVELELSFEGGDRDAGMDFIPESFLPLYQNEIVDGPRYIRDAETGPGTYLMIYDNVSGITAILDPLIAWRKKQGYNVIAVSTSTTGTSTTNIKNYIQNVYDNTEPPLEFVSLVGDATGTYNVACYFENLSGYGGEGDHYYTTLEGGDILPDVLLGRISVRSGTDLEEYVDKILNYEQNPPTSDPGWFTRATLVGDPGHSGITCIYVNQWAKYHLLQNGYTQVDTIWGGNFPTLINASVNQGASLFGYRGYYGMSGYQTGHADALGNGYEAPFAVVITCDTGSFSDDTHCMSEAWMRGYSGAAVGAVGTATIGTHTRYNNAVYNGIVGTLIYGGNHTQGFAHMGGKLNMYSSYYQHSPSTTEVWMVWNNLMGDPAVDIWSAYPTQLDVDYPGTLPPEANTVPVTVTSGGLPVTGARVALYKDGEVRSVAYTDLGGEVLVPLSGASNGTLYVTVTGHNLMPHQGTINLQGMGLYCVLNQMAVGGDGIASPGENAGLSLQLENVGTIPLTGVTGILSGGDRYVSVADGNDSFGDIPAGATAWGSGGFSVDIDADAPDGHVTPLELSISSGAGDFTALVEVEVASADFDVTGTTFGGPGGDLDPGESGTFYVTMRNNGSIASGSITASLACDSPWVSVTDSGGSFGSIGVGSTGSNSGNTFAISIAPDCFEGHLANFQMTLNYNSGATELVEFQVEVGSASSNDPLGPDAYGYYAFDNTDTGYPYAPGYSWVEIDPNYGGPGSNIGLSDYGWEDDDILTVSLPFDFQFYGEIYDEISVCSNGWISMGVFDVPLYRNWNIPAQGTPPAMIAPFWDNLYMSGSNVVYHWYDSSEHRYIIQWSRMRNDYSNATENFELILYDEAYHPTASGDGEILFQYNTVNNTDSRDAYATVGIQNREVTDGIAYTYWGNYPSAAATLSSGRAIRFLPVEVEPMGFLTGTVSNYSAGGIGVQDAHIRMEETGQTITTQADGSYYGSVPVGVYTVIAEHPSFQPDTLYNVPIVEDETTERNFSLIDIAGPSITNTTVQPYTDDTAGPYVIQANITDYSPMQSQTFHYFIAGTGSFDVPMALIDGGTGLYEAEIPGQPLGTYVTYWIEATDAGNNQSTDPPDAPVTVYEFWVDAVSQLYGTDMESDPGWTVGDALDDATTGIWERVDPNGTYNNTQIVQPEDDATTDPGVMCFITGQSAAGAGMGDNDVDGGQTTLYSPWFDLSENSGVTVSYRRWYTNSEGNSPNNDVWRVQVTDDGEIWVSLENTTESDMSWVYQSHYLDTLIELTSTVRFRFIASDEGDGSVVEAGVDEFYLTGFEEHDPTAAGEEGPPQRAVLLQNVPNPFNPKTEIRFGLPSAQDVTLEVYDIQGRRVTTLARGSMEAGFHSVTWNGTDDHGRSVSSGVYFYALQIDGRMISGKMALLK